ncbi:MAG: hypothetical protein NVS2B11_17670 [Acetobacteraceae bacterium]
MTEPYLIRLSQRSDGMDVAHGTFDGREVKVTSRNGASMAFARVVRAAGAADGPWVACGARDGKQRLQGPSLHGLARLTVSEGQSKPKIGLWVPHPMFDGDAT